MHAPATTELQVDRAARLDREAEDRVGDVVGGWRLVRLVGRVGSSHRYDAACTRCGWREAHTLGALRRAPVCVGCGANLPELAGEHRQATLERLRRVPRLSDATYWVEDPDAIAWVLDHPQGCTLHEVGRAFGISAERVRQIEVAALAKMRAHLEGRGFTAAEVSPDRKRTPESWG